MKVDGIVRCLLRGTGLDRARAGQGDPRSVGDKVEPLELVRGLRGHDRHVEVVLLGSVGRVLAERDHDPWILHPEDEGHVPPHVPVELLGNAVELAGLVSRRLASAGGKQRTGEEHDANSHTRYEGTKPRRLRRPDAS